MQIKKTKKEKTGLEQAIDDILFEMKGKDADSDEFAAMVARLDTLYKLKEIDKPKRVSADTLATITGNLVGIALIVGYERSNVMTSKALSFLRLR